MNKLLGFSIVEKFHDGNNNTLYRAVRSADQTPVVIKLPRSEYPSHRELARLHNEYRMLTELGGAGVPKAYSLERLGRTVALVLENMEGVPLSAVLASRQLTISESLGIAIALAQTLEQLHARQIVHRDIKPSEVGAERRGAQTIRGRAKRLPTRQEAADRFRSCA